MYLAQFLTTKKRSQRWLNVESEPLSSGVIPEANVHCRGAQRILEAPSQGNSTSRLFANLYISLH
jgi:hypothetical protein